MWVKKPTNGEELLIFGHVVTIHVPSLKIKTRQANSLVGDIEPPITLFIFLFECMLQRGGV